MASVRPCTGAKARQQRAIRSGVNPQRFKSANGSLSVLVAHVHQEVGVGAKQFWIVGGEFHPCLEPVAVKSVVAAGVERCVPTPRARFGDPERAGRQPQSAFGPLVSLKV